MDPSRVMIANALGYMSIGCWLCAQLPQVIKNASLKSCEGLALPFLCSWLFGDITNLIGCLLTDQLPFQTYLAIYFCTIDLALVGQYIHYRRPTQIRIPSTGSATQTPRYITYNTLVGSPNQSLILPPATAPPIRTRSSSGNFSSVPNTARPRTKRNQYPSANNIHYLQQQQPDINIINSSPADGSYAAIYEAALDVARAAERASHRRSRSKKRKLSRQTSTSNDLDQDGNENEDLADSFHSELSNTSSSTIGGGVGGNSPRSGNKNRLTQSTGTLLGDKRGRSLTRTNTRSPILHQNQLSPLLNQYQNEGDTVDGLPTAGTGGLGLILGGNGELQLQMRENKRSQSRSLSLARGSGGRGGRRAAGVAFMSLGFLVGIGGFSGSGITRSTSSIGKVLVEPTGSTSDWHQSSILSSSASSASYYLDTSSEYHENPYISSRGSENNGIITFGMDQKESPPHLPEEPPSFQRIIGRISAWSCTTLYLASRLPQIWKNFQRKSVEGLSILLFVMAFLGNTTYVSSILLNPAGGGDPNEAGHYLLEALPYLLGSGGTLIFDLTIMIQSLIYGSSPPLPIPPTPMERNSRRRGLFTKKRIKHIEDGSYPHTHNHTHHRSHSYTQSQSQSNTYNNVNERTSLLPPFPSQIQQSQSQSSGLGIIGLELNRNNNRIESRSRSRSKSPEKKNNNANANERIEGEGNINLSTS